MASWTKRFKMSTIHVHVDVRLKPRIREGWYLDTRMSARYNLLELGATDSPLRLFDLDFIGSVSSRDNEVAHHMRGMLEALRKVTQSIARFYGNCPKESDEKRVTKVVMTLGREFRSALAMLRIFLEAEKRGVMPPQMPAQMTTIGLAMLCISEIVKLLDDYHCDIQFKIDTEKSSKKPATKAVDNLARDVFAEMVIAAMKCNRNPLDDPDEGSDTTQESDDKDGSHNNEMPRVKDNASDEQDSHDEKKPDDDKASHSPKDSGNGGSFRNNIEPFPPPPPRDSIDPSQFRVINHDWLEQGITLTLPLSDYEYYVDSRDGPLRRAYSPMRREARRRNDEQFYLFDNHPNPWCPQ